MQDELFASPRATATYSFIIRARMQAEITLREIKGVQQATDKRIPCILYRLLPLHVNNRAVRPSRCSAVINFTAFGAQRDTCNIKRLLPLIVCPITPLIANSETSLLSSAMDPNESELIFNPLRTSIIFWTELK